MKLELNFFWRYVLCKTYYDLVNISAHNLSEAAKVAYNGINNLGFAFKFARELIDLNKNFRIFLFDKKVYVGKILSCKKANDELSKTKIVYNILNKTYLRNKKLEVITPIKVSLDNNNSMLLTEYLGKSLHESIANNKKVFTVDDFYELLNILLINKIDWRGLAPRNIFICNDKILLIDWEDVKFFDLKNSSFTDLTVFKLKLNWESIFGKNFSNDLDNFIKNKLPFITTSPLDNFEQSYKLLSGVKDETLVRNRCNITTLCSEVYHDYFPKNNFTFFELGHFIDDLFPNNISLVYSFTTAFIRLNQGDYKYIEFKDVIENNLKNYMQNAITYNETKESFLKNLQCIILSILLTKLEDPNIDLNNAELYTVSKIYQINCFEKSKLINNLKNYENLKACPGLNASVERAASAENILNILYILIKKCFNISYEHDLIIRGSLGQGLLTQKSDIDFEISNDACPYGQKHIEQLLIDILGVYKIEAEGSAGRPEERDIILINNLTRDFHEWTQLRKPLSNHHDPGWCAKYFKKTSKKLWLEESIYFTYETKITPKILFLKIRDKIARLAFYNDCTFANTIDQLNYLKNILKPEHYNRLYYLLEKIIEVYEINDNKANLSILNKNVESIYTDILSTLNI